MQNITDGRIDYIYIFLSHSLLDFQVCAGINSIIWSVHAPVWGLIQFLPPALTPLSWGLNVNWLEVVACLTEVRRAITVFLADHSSDAKPLPYKWEAFKCVLRGVFISHGACLKRIRTSPSYYIEQNLWRWPIRDLFLNLFEWSYLMPDTNFLGCWIKNPCG